MNSILIFKGFLIGFSVAAPIGPVCLIAIRQSAAYGFWAGIFTGVGAALADTVYSSIVVFGATFINAFLEENAFYFNLGGGAFLLFLGMSIAKTRLKELTVSKEGASLLGSFASAFIVSFLSPMTTVLFLSMFTGYGVLEYDLSSSSAAFSVVLGVTSGSMLWWVIVAYSVSKIYLVKPTLNFSPLLKQEGPKSVLRAALILIWPSLKRDTRLDLFALVNRLAGLAIASYGIMTLMSLL